MPFCAFRAARLARRVGYSERAGAQKLAVQYAVLKHREGDAAFKLFTQQRVGVIDFATPLTGLLLNIRKKGYGFHMLQPHERTHK